MRRGDEATLAFLAAVEHHTPSEQVPKTQAALARLCGELPQNFNRAVSVARRGEGSGATLARVAKWIAAWEAGGGVPLALVVTADRAAVLAASDVGPAYPPEIEKGWAILVRHAENRPTRDNPETVIAYTRVDGAAGFDRLIKYARDHKLAIDRHTVDMFAPRHPWVVSPRCVQV